MLVEQVSMQLKRTSLSTRSEASIGIRSNYSVTLELFAC